jgi:hypothetical protein
MAMTAALTITSPEAHAAAPADDRDGPVSSPPGAANPTRFTANLDGLTPSQVRLLVKRTAAAACRQAYRGGDITKEYDAAGFAQCVQHTASNALDQIDAAAASGQPMTKLTIAPEGPAQP